LAAVHGNGHTAVKLENGKVLVVGGDAAVIQPTAVAELFDPATNSFTAVQSMATARMLHFAVLLEDGRVLVGGGRGPDGADLASMEAFDPATNTFSPETDLPGPTSESGAVLVTGEVETS
jgi:hypothetical protein